MRIPVFAIMILLAGIATANADDWRLKRAFAEYDPPTPETRNLPPTVSTGTGEVAGMHGSEVFYVKVVGGSVLNRGITGNIERKIPLGAWRGKRVRLTLRLRTEKAIHASATVGITENNNVLRGYQEQWVRNKDAWQTYQFVREVPTDAEDFVIDLGLYGRGKLWIDDVTLVATDEKGAPAPGIRLQTRIAGNPDTYGTSPIVLPAKPMASN